MESTPMKTKDKVINIFCVYTVLSIAISIVAWLAVALGLVSIPAFYIAEISAAGWTLAGLAYVFGLFMCYRLSKYGSVSVASFAAYPAIQVLVLVHAFTSHGWYYAPSAGSQGTIPAVVISLAMLAYLVSKTRRPFKAA